MAQTSVRSSDAISSSGTTRTHRIGVQVIPIGSREERARNTEIGNIVNMVQTCPKVVQTLLANANANNNNGARPASARVRPVTTTTSPSQTHRRDISTLATQEDVIDTDRESNVSLLGGKYLLFSAPESPLAIVPGRKNYVKCVLIETREQLSCKMIPRNARGLAYLAAHYRFGSCDQHVNPIQEVLISPKSFYLISPPTYGSVHAYVLGKKRLLEPEAANLWKQMVCCVQACHAKGIIIRDLKMGKFVFVDKARTSIRMESLEDSALLENFEDDRLGDKNGCPNYVSPEKADIIKSNKRYPGKATDIWALGVILYTMLAGTYPFNDTDNSRLLNKIKLGNYTIPNGLSYMAKNLLKYVLRRNFAERPTCEEILRHPWLLKHLSQMNSDMGLDSPTADLESEILMASSAQIATPSSAGLHSIGSILSARRETHISQKSDDQVVPGC